MSRLVVSAISHSPARQDLRRAREPSTQRYLSLMVVSILLVHEGVKCLGSHMIPEPVTWIVWSATPDLISEVLTK